MVGFDFDYPAASDEASIRVAGLEVIEPVSRWQRGAWNVYGEGFRITGISDDETELQIAREGEGRTYATLASATKPVIAEKAGQWPDNLEIGLRSDGIGLSSVSLLLVDAGGEIFQLKQPVNAIRGSYGSLLFGLESFIAGDGLIVYGGDGNKGIDYPVRLYGFNFDFVRSGEAVLLSVTPPSLNVGVDGDVVPAPGAGGGAANMD